MTEWGNPWLEQFGNGRGNGETENMVVNLGGVSCLLFTQIELSNEHLVFWKYTSARYKWRICKHLRET